MVEATQTVQPGYVMTPWEETSGILEGQGPSKLVRQELSPSKGLQSWLRTQQLHLSGV